MTTMKSSPQRLSAEEIKSRLGDLKGWEIQNGKLHKCYIFKNFQQAFGFMTAAALAAESMDHHPEWFNVYKKVVVDLTTHEVQAISSLDFELALKMDALAAPHA